jgi:PKD repeat protein
VRLPFRDGRADSARRRREKVYELDFLKEKNTMSTFVSKLLALMLGRSRATRRASGSRRNTRQSSRSIRLALEMLEDRNLLSGFSDPGFETPKVGLGAYVYDPSGSAWTFSGTSGVAGNGSGFTSGNPNAPQGTQVAFMQGTGSVSQAVNLSAGTYTISFEAAQRGNWQDSSQTFAVEVDGQVVGTFTPDSTSYSSYTTDPFTVTAGTHTIAFVGLDPDGGDNTAFLDQLSIKDPSLPLTANAGPAESGNAGSPIAFTGSATGGSGSDRYSWNFGDGTAPVTGTLTPTHTYAAAGNYTVTLTVTDSAGDISQASTTATVYNNFTVNAGGPYSGIAGSPIRFTASASDPTDTSGGFTYTWSFGDGTTARGASVSHTYATAGNYTATVTVTESDGTTASANATVTVSGSGNGAPNEPLLYSSNLQLLGSFRVPNYTDGTDTLNFSNGVLAYDPTTNGLFITGQNGAIAEIAIPQTIVNSSNLDDLTTSTLLQPFTDVLDQLPQPLPADFIGNGQAIGGLLVQNGQLIGTDYAYYADGIQPTSHFVLDSLDLSTAQVQGLYPVNGRLAAGYMTAIPSEWQGVLGYPDLTGLSGAPIISTESSGPAALGFDPSTLSYATTASNTPFLYYPVNNPLGPYSGTADPLQNATSQVGGDVFVPGTSSLLFIGSTGTNYIGYGPPGIEGPWSLNGGYALQVWAYNANDLLAVEQGALQSWQVQPYDVWNLSLPLQPNFDEGSGGSQSVIGGVAFDAATNRLYVSVLSGDTEAPYSDLPLIYVFQVNVPSGSAPAVAAAPQVGTLAATPADMSNWPITGNGTGQGDAYTGPNATASVPAGTQMTLTAGNVYALTPGAAITQVAFYLSPNGGSVFNSSSDQLLGDGTPSTLANAEHNYTLTMSTAGLTSGTYTLFVQATDSDGQVSDVVETTLTIA